jgi:ubiquinone/menaquinone biosynthesis C-methylase UbiE
MKHKKAKKSKAKLGWGEIKQGDGEMWDAPPVFDGDGVDWKGKLKLIFYPKKFLLYGYVSRAVKQVQKEGRKPKIVDIGCGTGGAVIDFKKMFGKSVEVVGLDVVQLQVDVAQQKIKEHGVWAEIYMFDGKHLPFSDSSVDIIYTSDVLGHVKDVPAWLREITRVLKHGGTLAMFAESKLGKHAYIRNYLYNNGINTDPHAEFHISLYSKTELIDLLDRTGFEIKHLYSVFWAKFFVHPEELRPALKRQKKFKIIKWINAIMTFIKLKTRPLSLAIAEFYGLIEMVTLGRFVESQGYIIHAKKEKELVIDEGEKVTRFTSMSMKIPTSARSESES